MHKVSENGGSAGDLSKDNSFIALRHLLEEIKLRYDLSSREVLELLDKSLSEELLVPVSVFSNRKLSALESLCRFMKDNRNLSLRKIANILGRNNRTVWGAYDKSLLKYKGELNCDSKILIPISIFSDRKFSILENTAKYLKEHEELTYHEIAELLNRDDRTIWTLYNRALKKGGKA